MTFGTASDLWSQAARRTLFQRCVQVAPVRIVIGILFMGPVSVGIGFAGRFHGVGAVPFAALQLLVVLAFARFIEKRRAAELALKGSIVEWLAGAAIGIGLLSATTGVLVALGLYSVHGGGTLAALGSGFLLFFPQSLFEEILMRVVFFKIVEEAVGSWPAVILQALLFGALHLGNPNATVQGALAIAMEAGVLLATLYMLTRRIWMAWGLHFGWNWAQGSLFGIHVSGTAVPSWLLAEPKGSALVSGGAFGVEASPVAVVLCLLVASVILRAAMLRGQVVGYHTQRARVRVMRAV